jgi:hypothetical protein
VTTALLVIAAVIAVLVGLLYLAKRRADAWMDSPGDEDEPTEPILLPDDDGYLSPDERLLDAQVAARNAADAEELRHIERAFRMSLHMRTSRWLRQLDQSDTEQAWALLCSGSYPAVTT